MKIVDIAGASVKLDLDPEEVVLDVLVILRVTRLDQPAGTSAIVTAATDTTDYITQAGMMNVASQVMYEEQGD